ncbi:MAG: hypothetical protein K2M91_16915 [Lachnospiraceae bacterium]|nr:hypothetical protein [Lachnospiraceae bacterium]
MMKFRLYYDKDAETAWLNQMVEEGWAMKSFFGDGTADEQLCASDGGFCFAYNYTHNTNTGDYHDADWAVSDMLLQEIRQLSVDKDHEDGNTDFINNDIRGGTGND